MKKKRQHPERLTGRVDGRGNFVLKPSGTDKREEQKAKLCKRCGRGMAFSFEDASQVRRLSLYIHITYIYRTILSKGRDLVGPRWMSLFVALVRSAGTHFLAFRARGLGAPHSEASLSFLGA